MVRIVPDEIGEALRLCELDLLLDDEAESEEIAKALDPASEWPQSIWTLGTKYTPVILRFLQNIEPLSLDEVARLYNSHLHWGAKAVEVRFSPFRVKDKLRDSLENFVEVALDPQEQAEFQRQTRVMGADGFSGGSNHEARRAAGDFNVRMGEVVFSRASDATIVEWARVNSGRLIVEINDTTRRLIADQVANGIREQIGVEGTARRIRQHIGLTSHQAATALKHRSELIERGFGGSRLEAAYNRYLKTALRDRAQLIANNEIHVAVATGQNTKALALGREMKDWITVGDDRVDPNICRPNEALGRIPITALFFNSNSQTTPGHIRCRCSNGYYGGVLPQALRELRSPRRSTPATGTPRPKPQPKPPKPVVATPEEYTQSDFLNLAFSGPFDRVIDNASGKKEFLAYWNENIKIAPKEFFSRLLSGVSSKGELKLDWWDGEFGYRYDNGSGIRFERTISRTRNQFNVHHDLFVVPETAQGAGIAKRLLKNSMELYEQIGIKQIDTQANISIGAYAWAKYGFSPTDQRQWQRLTQKLTEKMYSLKPELRDAVRKVLVENANNPQAGVWAISDLKQIPDPADPKITVGKKMLIGQNWYAKLRLDDPTAMARFKDYVTKTR